MTIAYLTSKFGFCVEKDCLDKFDIRLVYLSRMWSDEVISYAHAKKLMILNFSTAWAQTLLTSVFRLFVRDSKEF